MIADHASVEVTAAGPLGGGLLAGSVDRRRGSGCTAGIRSWLRAGIHSAVVIKVASDGVTVPIADIGRSSK